MGEWRARVGREVGDADPCAELKSETDTCYFDDFDKPGLKMRGGRINGVQCGARRLVMDGAGTIRGKAYEKNKDFEFLGFTFNR